MRWLPVLALFACTPVPDVHPLNDPLEMSYAGSEQDYRVDPEALARAVTLAVSAIEDQNIWPKDRVEAHLRGLLIVVHPTLDWYEEWRGHRIAGCAWVDYGEVEVGSDFAGLAHEFGEMLYTNFEPGRPIDFQIRDWYGSSQMATVVARYLQELRHGR